MQLSESVETAIAGTDGLDGNASEGDETPERDDAPEDDAPITRDPIRRWGTDDNQLAEAYGLRSIGAAIRRGRLGQGLSQGQLGARTGLHQSTISRLETGRLRTMRMVTLARLIGVLRLGADRLFPDEPAPPTRHLPGEKAA